MQCKKLIGKNFFIQWNLILESVTFIKLLKSMVNFTFCTLYLNERNLLKNFHIKPLSLRTSKN